MDGGAGRATVHEVCELDTTEYTCVYHSPHHSPCSWDVQLTLRIQRFRERSVLIYHFGPAVVCSIWRYMPLTSEPMSCFLLLFSLSVVSDSLRPQGSSVRGILQARTLGKVKVAKSCQTLCDPMDYTVYEILQARILEWVVISFSSGSSQSSDRTQVSHIRTALQQVLSLLHRLIGSERINILLKVTSQDQVKN